MQSKIRKIIDILSEGQVPSIALTEDLFQLGTSQKTYNKDHIVKEIAHEIGFSQRDVQMVVDAFVRNINSVMQGGNKALISGLGRFEMQKLAAKQIQHPRTGQMLDVPERFVPRLHPSPLLRGQQHEEIETAQQIYAKMNNVKDFANDSASWIKNIANSLLKRVLGIAKDAQQADKFDAEFGRMLWKIGYGDPKQSIVDPAVAISAINKLLKSYGQPKLDATEVQNENS